MSEFIERSVIFELYTLVRSRVLVVGAGVLLALGLHIARAAPPEAPLDPLYRSTGDHKRFFFFPVTGTRTPARVYVPSDWRIEKAAPLVIILHGANLTEDSAFDTEPADLKGIIKKEADKHGFIVVSPLGYDGSGVGLFQGTELTAAATLEFAATANRRRATAKAPPAEDRSANALAEQDVLNIVEVLTREYNIDRARIYVMGNSPPSTGSWILAIDHPELLAAIAPSAAGVFVRGFPFERLKGIGVRMVVGERDAGVNVMRDTAETLKKAGVRAEEVEVPGGDHHSAWYMALPGTFDFFSQYAKR